MKTEPCQCPDIEVLAAGLASLFSNDAAAAEPVKILNRRENVRSSTFPTEIVTCRLPDGRELQVFCKYAAGSVHETFGHRGGPSYEATVYRDLLDKLPGNKLAFYGPRTTHGTRDTAWFALEYLDESYHVDETNIALCAHWIGRFHAIHEPCVAAGEYSFLNRYDFDYYAGWARRTLQYARDLHQQFPWLAKVCERFEEFIPTLLAFPQTVIHGEFYDKNSLIRRGAAYPVDWESTAIAQGEIDIAALTERWDPEIAELCEAEYQKARWPDGAPSDFAQRLCAARFYLQLRWLGDVPEWTTNPGIWWRFEIMHDMAGRLGLS